jgi:hypothetical protein
VRVDDWRRIRVYLEPELKHHPPVGVFPPPVDKPKDTVEHPNTGAHFSYTRTRSAGVPNPRCLVAACTNKPFWVSLPPIPRSGWSTVFGPGPPRVRGLLWPS